MDYISLYKWLVKTILEIYNDNQIENLLLTVIPNIFEKKENPCKKICEILLSDLTLLDITKEHNGKRIDLFIIKTNSGELITTEVAEDEWFKGKESRKTLTKQ